MWLNDPNIWETVGMEVHIVSKSEDDTDPNLTFQHFETLFGNDTWLRYLILRSESKTFRRWELEHLLLSRCAMHDVTI